MFKFASLVLSTLLLVACHKSTPPSVHKSSLNVDTTITDTIAEDNWQFTVYGAGWAPVPGADSEINIALNNHQLDMLLFFMKEPVQDTLPDYMAAAASGFQRAGAKLQEVGSTLIQNNQAALITLRTGKSVIWLWIVVKGNFAYDFSCVVREDPDASTQQFDFCNSMAQSIQIK